MKLKSWNFILILILGLMPSLQWPCSGSNKTAAAEFGISTTLPAAGALDPTYGNGGLVTADMYRNSYGKSVALQTDGKIVQSCAITPMAVWITPLVAMG